MTTISFSVEPELADELKKLAADEQRSASDVLREMWRYYAFKKSLAKLQENGQIIAARLGLETDDDVARYLRAH